MSDETIRTLAWAAVFLFAIQGFTIYAVVRLLTTGRDVFERRPSEYNSRSGNIIGIER